MNREFKPTSTLVHSIGVVAAVMITVSIAAFIEVLAQGYGFLA